MLFYIALTVIVAICIYQAYLLGQSTISAEFMREHLETIQLWHVETFELNKEIKRLQAENDQLKRQHEREESA